MSGAGPVTIRGMRQEDAAAVADLTSQLGYPASEADTRRRYDLIKEREDARVLVAQDAHGSVVGWVHAQATYLLEGDPRAEIWGLVVGASVRGTGVGRLLVEAAEQWALSQGFAVMSLRSNRLRREAHAFYEHLGYQVVKTQSAFRKSLKPPTPG